MNKDRYKNPYFWIGLIGVLLTAMGVNLQDLTDWNSVQIAFRELVTNPFMIITAILAILGVFVNPTTKGIKDFNE